MAASVDLKSKEEKDAELDKRIEALRRKNQALIKRYQEIEEDRKKAEQEGIAVTGGRRALPADGPHVSERRQREAGPPTLTVQVMLSPEEKRVVSDERRPSASYRALRSSPNARGSVRGVPGAGVVSPPQAKGCPEPPSRDGAAGDSREGSKRGRGSRRPGGRGGPAGDSAPDRRSKEWEERRRQNIEKMNEEMEKIAEYEQSQRDGLQEKNPVRNFLDDPRRSGPFAESDRREGSRRHVRNWGGASFDKVKAGMEQGKAWPPVGRGGARRRDVTLDMTLSMTGRERAEYLRWKQEREQIDRERLARHRQATGEWRREWDAEKLDTTKEPRFKEVDKPRGSVNSKQGESRRPPKLPTFGAFLPEHRPERRRKGRGRGPPRGAAPCKPYSMHDNRWEEKEEEQDVAPVEAKSDAAAGQQEDLPASPHLVPDEDEDQWEDVSEGEEEEEEEGEGGIGQGSSSVREEVPPATSSSLQAPLAKQPGPEGHPCLTLPPPETEAASVGGKPLTPFSPAEGYHPVSDWGEEMELSSPKADGTQSSSAPLAAAVLEAPLTGVLWDEQRVPEPEPGSVPEPGGEEGPAVEAAQSWAPRRTVGSPDSSGRRSAPEAHRS